MKSTEIDEPNDCTKVIRFVQGKDVKYTNLEELVAKFDWEPKFAEKVMKSLIKTQISVVERKDASKGTLYYFPGLISV